MSYFIRHTSNPEADQSRGFSFVGYQLFSSREIALETVAENLGVADSDHFDIEKWSEENEWRVGQDNVTLLWGQRRSGLCAYAEYETLDEAVEALLSGDYGNAAGGDAATYAAVFEGRRTFDADLDSGDDGCTFAPQNILFVRKVA